MVGVDVGVQATRGRRGGMESGRARQCSGAPPGRSMREGAVMARMDEQSQRVIALLTY